MFVDLVTDHRDRFIVRFWNYTENEHESLLRRFRGLSSSNRGEEHVRLSTTVFGISTLVLKAFDRDRGARIAASENAVVWELEQGSWNTVVDLSSRVQAGSSSFRWLDDQGEVSVLLSPSGRW
jgi:hypothetical protein